MYEVDFWPVERTGEIGSKSGDAITMRFTEESTGITRVVVIDAGYKFTGEQTIAKIAQWYQTDFIDLVISTHPDQDHINGLTTVLDQARVGELMVHNPHDHSADASDFSNIEVVDALIGLAEDKGVKVTEPFTGVSRFGGQLTVLGPTISYYEELVHQHLTEIETGVAKERMTASGGGPSVLHKALDYLERKLSFLPIETLGEDGDSGPRNDSSAIVLLKVDGERMLFTGDAGITALHAAWDEYEAREGSFPDTPLDFFQAPHHGSRRNLSPSLLNRIFGEPGVNPLAPTSFISSALNDEKHPSPKVTNALQRRGVDVFATESKAFLHKSSDIPMRDGYSTATAIGPLEEDD